MPILKDQDLYNGETAGFHSILKYDINVQTGGCSCVLGSWASQEEFLNGEDPLLKRVYQFTTTTLDVMDSAYESILKEPGFKGGIIIQ